MFAGEMQHYPTVLQRKTSIQCLEHTVSKTAWARSRRTSFWPKFFFTLLRSFWSFDVTRNKENNNSGLNVHLEVFSLKNIIDRKMKNPPNKQCSILSDRHWGEPSQSTKGPICVSYTVFHDPVGRSSERMYSLRRSTPTGSQHFVNEWWTG